MRESAAAIGKGQSPVMILSEADTRRFIDPRALINQLKEGFRQVARGDIQLPRRPEITVPGKGFMLSMPAWLPGGPMMVKMVSVFEGNLDLGLPNHLATIVLFDEATGATISVMDGTYITGVRTAASAIVSVDLLARRGARIATVVGAGVQGREHLRLLPLVRDFDEIRIASLVHDDAVQLARSSLIGRAVDDLEAAVRGSDVVCLASHAYEPVIKADWIAEGTHVTSVGYAPPRGELPVQLLERGRLFVEDLCAFEPTPVGCAELSGRDPASAIVLGQALDTVGLARRSATEITIYKAMGIAMEDLVAATLAFESARRAKHPTVAVL